MASLAGGTLIVSTTAAESGPIIMKVLILISFLAAASAADLLGQNKCTQGPSYWCSHISNAKECGAVQHCKDNVWSPKYAKQNDEVCDFCTEVIKTVRSLIANNATEQQIMGFLKSACDLIPDESLKDMCLSAVNDYAEVLFDLIISELDPETVCTAIGLCKPGAKKEPVIKPMLEIGGRQDLCTDCKAIVSEAKQALEDNKTKEEILELFDELCESLGPFEEQCKNYMDQYIPVLLDLLATELDPQTICAAIGFCPKKTVLSMKPKLIVPSVKMTPAKKVDSSLECTVCEFAMQEIDSLLTQNSTASEIISVVDKVCSILPQTIRAECKAFIDDYGSEIIQLLVAKLNPTQVCTKLGLCAGKTLKSQPLKDAECDVCKLVMQYFDGFMEKNQTKQEIVKALHEFCDILPGSIRGQCNDLITQYGYAIPELIEQLMDPLKVCQLIGLCGPTNKELLLQSVKTTPVKDTPTCALCEFVLRELDSMLADNATQSEIIAAVDQVCSLLPGSLGAECKSFVDEYGPAVIQLLISQIEPQQICTLIGLCTSNEVKVPKVQDTGCDVCKLAAQYLLTVLDKNATQQEIEQALEEVCSILPASIKDECTSLVEEYGPVIFQLLQSLTADEVCQVLGLCTGNPLLGAKKCSFGPAFWCASETNAKMCNAVQHCKLHVW
ncbi:prosaposin-like isoform X1 [Ptychodera flava]|uniref:prosaposin-like isoform X1 n=1 Tax=Ptychodera flava TaxID=63121 RepID=UPI00396A0D64